MIFRARLSPTMDRFLATQFLGPFLVCLATFTVAYLLGDVFDRFNDLVHYGGLGLLGLEYFMLKLPLIISQLLPMACLAGVLLGFAMLNRTGEVLACQQLGISRLAMAAPVLAIAVVVSLFDFGLSETIVPLATREAHYLFHVRLTGRKINGVFANRRIWVRVKQGFLSADRYSEGIKELRHVTLYRLAPDYTLLAITQADGAKWNGHTWQMRSPSQFKLDPDGKVTPQSPVKLGISLKPSDLELLKLTPEEFTLWELNRYIKSLRSKGLDPGDYVVDRDLKYAMPIACLIMAALAVALSLDPLPRNLSLGRSFGLAVLIGFVYWVALGISSSLGRSGTMPPWLAAWLPNLLFGMIAGAIFLFGEER